MSFFARSATICKKVSTSDCVFDMARLALTTPVSSVPRCLCIRGAQCSPALVATSKFCARWSATTPESQLFTLKDTIPLSFCCEYTVTLGKLFSPSSKFFCSWRSLVELLLWLVAHHLIEAFAPSMAGVLSVPDSNPSGMVLGCNKLLL